MSRGDVTVIIARRSEAPVQKYTFSRKFLLSLGVTVLILLSSFTLSNLHYYYMWKKTTEYSQLKVEVDQLRKENESFRLAANQLNEKISTLEMTSKKLKIFSGLDREGLGGVGGPSRTLARPLPRNNRDLAKYFNTLGQKGSGVEMELRRLQEFYTAQSLVWAATPLGRPVHGYPSDLFGYRSDPFSGKLDFHTGLDLSSPDGNPVTATADGLILFAGRWFGYGKLVTISHGFGMTTRYGHMSRVAVRVGQRIKKGDIIGYVGSTGRATGPHLHYEVRLNDQPLNPMRFF